MSGPPDFVGVGTAYAGAGWWHDLLLMHPQIRAPGGEAASLEDPKALHFFDELCRREMTGDDIARYHAFFAREEGTIVGEWTPRYMHDPWTPFLLRRAAPGAKLLVMLGDPVERYRERLARARLRAESEAEQLYMAHALSRGRYALQLERLWAVFDREQTLVLQHERCRADPRPEYARTLRFLGVRDHHVPLRLRTDLRPRARAVGALRRAGVLKPPPRAELWPDIEQTLHAELDGEVRRLTSLVPEIDLRLWPNFAHLAFS